MDLVKPLEMVIYPKGEDHHGNPAYLSGDGKELYMLAKDVEYDAIWKHLEDAELAAEYWQARDEYRCVMANEPETPGIAEAIHEAWRRSSVLHRFATLPHALED